MSNENKEIKEEIEELKRALENLTREVEMLKKEVKPTAEGEKTIELRGILPFEREQLVDYILKNLEKMLEGKAEGGIVFIGGIERKGGRTVGSYLSSIDLKDVIERPPKDIVKVISPLSNENRVRILQELLKGSRTSSELLSNLGLESGQLYHHLKELMLAGYIETAERGRYTLTSRGCMAIRTIACLASIPGMATLRPEEIEEELRS